MSDPLAWLDESTPAFWRVSKMRHNELHALLVGLRRARDSWKRKAIDAWEDGYNAALADVRQQFNFSDHLDEFESRLQWIEAEGTHRG